LLFPGSRATINLAMTVSCLAIPTRPFACEPLLSDTAHRFRPFSLSSVNRASPRFLSAWLFALVATAHVPTHAAENAPATVGRWDSFELSIRNPKSYADPYRDVTLEVTYTRPDNRTVAFPGFHDGGETWKMRLMPDQIGSWRYDAKFSDGTPAVRGSFECVPSRLPGLIAVHAANPIWFGHQGGSAVVLRGLHLGDRFFAHNWDDPDNATDGNKRTAFLDWAQQQGYNLFSVASHYLNRNSKGRGEGWDTPALWPLNAAGFQRIERILDELAKRQIMVYPFAGFFGRDSNFPRDPAEQDRYLRYTLARLGAYWNVLFNVGGPEPRLKGKPYLTVEDIHRLGEAIARNDPFAHPLSLHNPTGDNEFKDAPWLTFGTLQGPKTLDRRRLAAGLLRNHHPTKPLLAQETLWSGNMFHMRSNQRDYSDADLRKHAYVIHFCAANFVFADNNGDSSSGFTGTLDPADCKQPRHDIIKRVWDTFAALPFARTKPAPELVQSSDTAVFCLADPGRDYLVYFEAPGSATLRLADGEYSTEWINAQTPSDRRRENVATRTRTFRSPSDGDDWILRLSRVDTP
jgi:hypothetical protein